MFNKTTYCNILLVFSLVLTVTVCISIVLNKPDTELEQRKVCWTGAKNVMSGIQLYIEENPGLVPWDNKGKITKYKDMACTWPLTNGCPYGGDYYVNLVGSNEIYLCTKHGEFVTPPNYSKFIANPYKKLLERNKIIKAVLTGLAISMLIFLVCINCYYWLTHSSRVKNNYK